MKRSKQKKRMPRLSAVAVGVASLAIVAVLAGCASAGDATETASASDEPRADAAPTTLTVFAAASLTEAFDTLVEQFEAEHPNVDVVLNPGGSAALAQQIVEGAPADVFASAAEPPMQTVADAGLAVDPVVFASNTLELVVPAGNRAGVTGLTDLARPELRVALCDVSVPCGAASADLLERAGIIAAPDTLESDVKAVLTKVVLGEVDAALVYRTDVRAAGGGDVEGIEVPGAASVVNGYPITMLTDAAAPDVAAEFTSFVAGAGRAVLDAAGFGAP